MKMIRFFLPRIEYILLAAVFWSIIANGPRILNIDGDLPRHLLVGNLILQTQHVSPIDIFSFRTVGFPSIPHEWLSQIIFALAYNTFGLNGVVLLTGIIAILVWSVIFYDAKNRSNNIFITLLITVVAIGVAQIHMLPRPHLFTYLFIALWIVLLERIEQGDTRAWRLLPFTMLLWVNLHGMFVIGLIILGIYLTGDFLDRPSGIRIWLGNEKVKALMTAGALSFLAAFLSPSGAGIWKAILSLGSNTYITARIPELQSANFHIKETWPFILMIVLTMIGFARSTKKISWTHLLMVVAFVPVALYASRMIPLFALVSAPIVTKALADWARQEYPENRLSVMEKNIAMINASSNGLIWMLALVMVVVILLQTGKTIDPQNRGNVFDDKFFPVEATSWLQSHPQNGHMFNEFDWGGFLLLQLWPAQQIFMDGHIHIFGEVLIREYEIVITVSNGWEDILAKYKVEWVIVRAGAPLINALKSNGNWAIAYQDQTAVILIRK